VFSEIFYKNGVRMPVKEICTAAKNYGAYSIVDSAHAWGMIRSTATSTARTSSPAPDTVALRRPGEGIFYIRNTGDNLPPFAMGNFFLYGEQFTAPSLSYNTRTCNSCRAYLHRRISRSSCVVRTTLPPLFAMTDSAAFFSYIGLMDIYERRRGPG